MSNPRKQDKQQALRLAHSSPPWSFPSGAFLPEHQRGVPVITDNTPDHRTAPSTVETVSNTVVVEAFSLKTGDPHMPALRGVECPLVRINNLSPGRGKEGEKGGEATATTRGSKLEDNVRRAGARAEIEVGP